MSRKSDVKVAKPRAKPAWSTDVLPSAQPLFASPVSSAALKDRRARTGQCETTTHNFAHIPLFPPGRSSRPVQSKLSMGMPGDKYEQEADRIADKVMGMRPSPVNTHAGGGPQQPQLQQMPWQQSTPLAITPWVQRQTIETEEEEEETPVHQAKTAIQRQEENGEQEEEPVVQAKPFVESQAEDEKEERELELQSKTIPGRRPTVSTGVASSISAMQGRGQPLSPAARSFMEPRFGHDFSKVRIHADSHAADTSRQINARAFTAGNTIAFGSGQYQPHSASGRKLLAHELTHVVQQGHAVHQSSSVSGRQANRSGAPSAGTPAVQASFISFAIKMGAKKVAKGTLKNFIKTQIKGKIKKLASKKFAQRFAKEADDLVGILEDPWWATAVGFIPVVGDAFDLVRVPKQIAKAMRKADKLEAKIKTILRIQGKKASDLITGKSKRSDSYFSDLEDKTYAALIKMAEQGDSRARKMRKLIEEAHRLSEKL